MELIMEDYPSLAEGNGLENRQVGKTTQEFESLILLFYIIAGWSSLVARRAHNPKVASSNLAPAIFWSYGVGVYHACLSRRRSPVQIRLGPLEFEHLLRFSIDGSVAQSVEQRIEAPCVGGSIPSRAISIKCGCSLVVKPQPSKLLSRVRFSSPAYDLVVVVMGL